MVEAEKVQLILGDVDTIKAFVYESNALPDIRGGSEILVGCEDEVKKLLKRHISEKELVYCGGGGFLAIVPEGMAEKLKQEIERLYLDKTKAATITVVYSEPIERTDLEKGIPINNEQVVHNLKGKGIAEDLLFSHFDTLVEDGDRLKRKNFGEWVAWLSSKLQQAKRQKVFAPFFPTLPVHERCQACGKRAVSDRDNLTGEMLCSVCWKKRFEGRKKRRIFVKDFADWAKEKKGVEIPKPEERVPKDLDTLTGSDGRISFLYADGNNMGELLQRMKTAEDYRKFSNSITNAAKEALFKALWEIFENQLNNPTKPLPFEIIAIGGDDVVVIVPSRHGWKLGLKFLEEFEKQTQNLQQGKRLTMSAGLVIADVKYPVRFLMDLAEGLLKQAKELARETNESTICHLWLRSPITSEDAKKVLKSIYYRKSDKQEIWLTTRPFTLQLAKRLSELSKELKSLPSSQRRLLAESLDKGVRTSLNLALYQASKYSQKTEKLLKIFFEFGKLLGNEVNDTEMYFWRKKGDAWRTALLDALELIELGAID